MFVTHSVCAAHWNRPARRVHSEQNSNFFEKLTNGRHPKPQSLMRAQLCAGNLARLLGRKAPASFDHANRAILFCDAAAWKALHAAEKPHLIGTPGEKYFKPLRLRLPQ